MALPTITLTRLIKLMHVKFLYHYLNLQNIILITTNKHMYCYIALQNMLDRLMTLMYCYLALPNY